MTSKDQLSSTRISRRDFLAYSASSAALLAQHRPATNPERRTVSSNCGSGSQRSLILVHLRGGNDSLNTLVPYSSQKYHDARPNIALNDNEIIKLDKQFALNAALTEMAALYKNGMVAIFPAVDCAQNLTMSHERASQIWNTARPEEVSELAWIERLNRQALQFEISEDRHVHETLASIKKQTAPFLCKVSIDGFDTHENQKADHFNALRRLSIFVDGANSLLNDDDRRSLFNGDAEEEHGALIFVYSEFGRSLNENEMLGTDHGRTGLCFAIGSSVLGGIFGAAIFRSVVIGARVGSAGVRSTGVRGTGVRGTGVGRAGVRGAGVHGAGVNGACENGAGMSGAGMSSAGVRGAGVRGAGVRGTSVSGAGVDGTVVNGFSDDFVGFYGVSNGANLDGSSGNGVAVIDFRQLYATIATRWLNCDAEKLLGRAFSPIDFV